MPRKSTTKGSSTDTSKKLTLSLDSPIKVYFQNLNITIEIIGDTKVKIAIYNDEEDYDTLDDSMSEEELNDVIDEIDEVNEEYLG